MLGRSQRRLNLYSNSLRHRCAYFPFMEWCVLRSAVLTLPMTVSGQANSFTRTEAFPPPAAMGARRHPAVATAPKHDRPSLQALLPGATLRRKRAFCDAPIPG